MRIPVTFYAWSLEYYDLLRLHLDEENRRQIGLRENGYKHLFFEEEDLNVLLVTLRLSGLYVKRGMNTPGHWQKDTVTRIGLYPANLLTEEFIHHFDEEIETLGLGIHPLDKK